MSNLFKILRASRSKPQQIVRIDGKSLSLEQLSDLGQNKSRMLIDDQVRQNIQISRQRVELKSKEVLYGINTGFGRFSNVKIEDDKLKMLQYNLIRSHAIGTSAPLSIELTRKMLVLRINSLSKGLSGMSPQLFEGLVEMYRNNIIPLIPNQGTVGASGDLSPLAFLAMTLIGESKCWDFECGQFIPTSVMYKRLNIIPPELHSKDGLSLINGTQFITAVGSKALEESINLIRIAQPIAALSFLALKGNPAFYYSEMHENRNHQGQIYIAETMKHLLPVESCTYNQQLQDPYCVRCVPQVHGPVVEQILNSKEAFEREFNAATDNPLVFKDCIVSGGNFHGEYPAKTLDALSLYAFELGSISFGRIRRILNEDKNHGLPTFIAPLPGLTSGFMIWENVAAALLAENRGLVNPASVDSHSTGADKEDHVSMGGYAARKANQLMTNLSAILAVELVCACHGIHFIMNNQNNTDKDFNINKFPILQKIYNHVLELCPPLKEQDRFMYDEYQEVIKFIESGQMWKLISKDMENTHLNQKQSLQQQTDCFLVQPYLTDSGILENTKLRGNQVDILNFGQLQTSSMRLNNVTLDNIKNHLKSQEVIKFVIIDGSQDSISSRANFKHRGDNQPSTAYNNFIKIVSNFQLNKINIDYLSKVQILGQLDFTDLISNSVGLTVKETQSRQLLKEYVHIIEKRTYNICKSVFDSNKNLIYVNGSHNTVLPIVKAFYDVNQQKPIVINLDLKSDCRKSSDGPHSSSWCSELFEQGLIEQQHIIGLNILNNNYETFKTIEQYNIIYEPYTWDKIQQWKSDKPLKEISEIIAKNIHEQYGPQHPIILTICMDSIQGIASSGQYDNVGYAVQDVYHIISTLAQKLNIVSLNLAEYDPSFDSNQGNSGAELMAQSSFLYTKVLVDKTNQK